MQRAISKLQVKPEGAEEAAVCEPPHIRIYVDPIRKKSSHAAGHPANRQVVETGSSFRPIAWRPRIGAVACRLPAYHRVATRRSEIKKR